MENRTKNGGRGEKRCPLERAASQTEERIYLRAGTSSWTRPYKCSKEIEGGEKAIVCLWLSQRKIGKRYSSKNRTV